MRSTRMLSLLLPLLVLTGCGSSALPAPVQPAATAPAPQTPPPPPPANPAPAQPVNTLSAADLAALGDPRQLQPQDLADWLARVANQSKEPLLPRLQAVLELVPRLARQPAAGRPGQRWHARGNRCAGRPARRTDRGWRAVCPLPAERHVCGGCQPESGRGYVNHRHIARCG